MGMREIPSRRLVLYKTECYKAARNDKLGIIETSI